jgi:hypothetical protein
MPFPLIPLLLGGSSILGGLLGGRDRKVTTEPNLSPIQQQVQTGLGQQILGDLNAPVTPPNVTPLRSGARNQVNRTANAAGGRLDTALAGSGFYNSGKRSSGRTQIETARLGAFSDIETDLLRFLTEFEEREKQRRKQNALAFLPGSTGQTTTQSGGGAAAGGAAGLETISSLFVLDKLLGGAGLFGGAGGGGAPSFDPSFGQGG